MGMSEDDASLGVPDDRLDLIDRIGEVDRERRGAQVDGGAVQDVELRAVRERQPTASPGPTPSDAKAPARVWTRAAYSLQLSP